MELEEYHKLFEDVKTRYPNWSSSQTGYYLKVTPEQDIVSGDKVFIYSLRAGFTKKEVVNYILSLGASVVSDINMSTKILFNKRLNIEWSRYEILPTEIDPLIVKYGTRVMFDSIKGQIRSQRVSGKERFSFSEESYKNIIQLLKSNTTDNIKIACICMMSVDWTSYEFCLFYLFTTYTHEIRSCIPSKIPNWSDWSAGLSFSLVQQPSLYELWHFMRKFIITEEQQTIIKKYL